jgi:hypothetical protein
VSEAEDGIAVDGRAMDALALAFAQCRELGIEVTPLLPLGTPGCQRAAAAWLGRLVTRAREDQERRP